ncbi:arylamine N-acetyltransferase, pineal gland isozyme NAT-10-like [Thalassophryne amazonica]|uniref:arylamine N-acetyltransferase, pineal gland isozyme NAT-10-like n=1 Tax=Thalassophryne amazonica TaxID=390379 RepID=UPI001470E8CC|nr:arylamine N-acetyltransferase, pineal gland isozyme NAT-10-like [Thalassophryne amazonica]
MNLEEYLERVGFCDPHDKLDLPTLSSIHRHHVLAIPFENLSIHCGEKLIIDLEVIFDKLVRSRRGGWCFENNFLFAWVLKELGYNMTTLGSRIFSSSLNDFDTAESHLINMVVIEGKKYLADVGFGVSYQLREPLELVSGKDQPQAGGVFRLIDTGDVWVLEKTGRKPKILNPEFASSSLLEKKLTKQIYCFSLLPRKVDHFFEINEELQTGSDSLFTNKSICSLQMPKGFHALVGWIYSEVTYNPEEGVDTYDMKEIPDEEIEQILSEKFNVKLPNKFQPMNNRVIYTL